VENQTRSSLLTVVTLP